jgi:eukaryotic-like serine/threonine-protein kinase
MSDADRHLMTIFATALEREDGPARDAYLAEACAAAPELRARVEALLRAHGLAGHFLEPTIPARHTSELPADLPPDGSTGHWEATLATGSVVAGRYKLLEEIGEGGMGSVWMAQQTEPVRRKVALKLIKPGMDSRQVLARFEAERQALALMDHPNIAKVLDGGATEGGRPFFVMELVKGVSITTYCDDRRLSPRDRLGLFAQVCAAVQHAHQKGVIHRDLKPSNVLVAPYDGVPVPKVIDFGVAKAAGQPLTEKTLFTGIGAVVGTPEYMSPEQAELNNADIDTRSDVYALGVLLYELLTGTTPLTRRRRKEAALLEVLRIVREEEPPRPSTRLSTTDELPTIAANRGVEPRTLSGLVQGELDWIVMKALEKDRGRRYATANGLAEDVRRFLAHEPVQACPPSATYRLRKFVRRNRAWVGTAAAVAALLVVATAVSAALAVWAREAEGVARSDRSRAEGLARTEAAARARADEQTKLATDRAADLAWRLYVHRANLAYREATANNVAGADALLEACELRHRGWEWSFCWRLCHMEAMTLGGFPDHAAAVSGARRGPADVKSTGDPALDFAIRSLTGVRGSVRGVAFSPDGKRIATAHDDGTVGIYDARTGREVRSLVGHIGSVSSVTFDGAGHRIITGGFDRTVRVWDADTGEPKFVLRGHTRPVLSVAFRPGTDQVASSTHGAYDTFLGAGFEIKQWDLAGGKEIRTLHHRRGWSYTSVAFSHDGRHLFSSAVWGGRLRVWDPESGKEVAERGFPQNSRCLAVSPADGRVAFGCAGDVGITEPQSGPGLRTFCGHNGTVLGVAFSPDGTRVASASEDGTVKVWGVADGREVAHLRGHTGGVTAVVFGRDGNTLVTTSEDGTAKVWEVSRGGNPFPLDFRGWVTRVRFSPDGRHTATVNFSTVTVADAATNRSVARIIPGAKIDTVAFSRDGRLVATSGAATEEANVWDAETGRRVATCRGHAGRLLGMAFGNGRLLATASDDGTVRLWDAETGRPGPVLPGHEGGAFGMAFDPAGAVLATVGWDGVIRLWEVPAGRPLRQLGRTTQRRSDHWPDALAFSPDGLRLAASNADGTAVVWEVATGTEVLTLRGHTRALNGVAYSPDGRRIATWSDDYSIKLWDAATGDEVFALRGHTGFVLGLAFSPDGHRILSTSADETVRVWDSSPIPAVSQLQR